MRYCLLDEIRIADSELESLRNLAAALFRLEKSRGPQDIQRILQALAEWLRGDDLKELRKSFTLWLLEVLIPARIPGMTVPKVTDLMEVKAMLAERVMEWTEQWKQEGLEEGRKKGRQEGVEKVRSVLSRSLEKRFGPLPAEVRRGIDALKSIEDLTLLSFRAGSISSLSDLELSGES